MNYDKNIKQFIPLVRRALKEDIGRGDITTKLTIPKNKKVKAVLLAKEDCIVCGLDIARLVFKEKDKNIKFKPKVHDGKNVTKGMVLARLEGEATSILTAERVALNFLSLLSGITTKTKQYINATRPYKIKIMDTRKTIPGLRELQKYAVRIGGGYSHRIRLDEMVLIKDNHLKAIEGFEKLPKFPKGFKIEIEAQNLKEFKHALRFKPDVIMLDNMSVRDIKEAVKIRNQMAVKGERPKIKLEASGGINLKNVKKVAACGIEIISVGELTHSIKSIDMSLEIL
jgi:nicotinate-nucleotide pyrophosphorylase (carboxylating)